MVHKATGTSVIVKVAAVPTLDKIYSSYHFNESSTLQLINSISNDLQKLLKYFNGKTTFTFSFFLFAPSASVLPVRLALYLNEEALLIVKLSCTYISSLLNCHRLPEVSE